MKSKSPFTAVVANNEDPLGLGRVLLKLPEAEDGPPLWAPMLVPQAGSGQGVWFRPDIGDEVVVDFLNGNPQRPVVLGALWSPDNPPPPAATEEHMIRSRSGHTIALNDDRNRQQIAVTSANGRQILIDDSTQQGRIEIRNATGTLRILVDDTTGTVTIEATSGDIVLDAGGDINLKATNISLDAAAQINITGASAVDVSTSAVATVKGAVARVDGSLIQLDGAQVLVNGNPLP